MDEKKMKIIRTIYTYMIMETYQRNDHNPEPSYIKIFIAIHIHAKNLLFITDEI